MTMQVLVGCVGSRRVAEAAHQLESLPLIKPLAQSPLAPHVGQFVVGEAVHAVDRFLKSGMRMARSGRSKVHFRSLYMLLCDELLAGVRSCFRSLWSRWWRSRC